ncbi:MAG TPA: roadblock/LC7 domain-containing protein [Acidobacteriota bacterium]|nr:roadblock/LC7 domain-containing protein [Acidobacteriota bacterium]
MEALNNLLKELAAVSGVQAALVVGHEGFVIDGVSTSSGLDNEVIGATISAEISSAAVMGDELKLGNFTHLMIEFEKGVIVINTIGSDALLAVVAEKDAMLGNIRYQVKKYTPAIENLL